MSQTRRRRDRNEDRDSVTPSPNRTAAQPAQATSSRSPHPASHGTPSPTPTGAPQPPTGRGPLPGRNLPRDPNPNQPQPAATTPITGRKNTKSHLKISTLNMRGGRLSNSRDKWDMINQMLREERIGILALQETHLTDEDVDSLHCQYHQRLHIIHSGNPTQPNACGVAFVVNKHLVAWREVSHRIIIPGRAILLTTRQYAEKHTSLLNVYAPNDHTCNGQFWTSLHEYWRTNHLPAPDTILGDFNVVDSSLDRLPPRSDPPTATDALHTLMTHFHLVDGWRHTFPSQLGYTFRQHNSSSQSRLDRIYITRYLLKHSRNWSIAPPGFSTDHKTVSMELFDPTLPYIGEGRWSIPLFALRRLPLLNQIEALATAALSDMEASSLDRTPEANPQTILASFKRDATLIARDYARKNIPRLDARIRKEQEALKEVLRNELLLGEDKAYEAGLIDERIQGLEELRFRKVRDNTKARNILEGETISKYWSSLNKNRTPRDTIKSLRSRNPGPPTYLRRSDDMAAEAGRYHNNLQFDTSTTSDPNRNSIIDEVLDTLDIKLPDDERPALADMISEGEVAWAIGSLPLGKAGGLDGIPHELWRHLADKHEKLSKVNKPSCNVYRMLSLVFNDIHNHGSHPTLEFSDGWMCPIYKKKDRTDIANYRPITVLNADYKIFTKLLTKRLTQAAPKLIHKDQAGFITGRHATDHTELANLVIRSCTVKEINGAIISLDQEKAYDRVMHDFLWKTLDKLNFPPRFTSLIRSLYESARTTVIINGVQSPKYDICRGVRQGDPLSCLLFNLAIESLACMIRKSELLGLSLSARCEPIKLTLFADDTTVFLSENDDVTTLNSILDKWCTASGAKFNTEKTIIIPVGTHGYRQQAIESRKLNPASISFPPNLRIARDGEPVRILGCFVGNNVEQEAIWTPTVDKIVDSLAQWSKSHPTIMGRRLIINMEVAGRTQYLTYVQGMPPNIEKRLSKLTADFIWDNRSSHPINLPTLDKPLNDGGLKLLNLKARNEAIELRKVRSFLNFDQRPTWSYLADDLYSHNSSVSTLAVNDKSRLNPFLQAWCPKTSGKYCTLPDSLIRMFRTAKKYQVALAPIAMSKSLKASLPVWSHLAIPKHAYPRHPSIIRCLRDVHRISTVGETVELASTALPSTHQDDRPFCRCAACRPLSTAGCPNPSRCLLAAGLLVLATPPFWNPLIPGPDEDANLEPLNSAGLALANGSVAFNSSMTTSSLAHGFRVFYPGPIPTQQPTRPPPPPLPPTITVFTDGSSLQTNEFERAAGCGIWYSPDNPQNMSLRVPSRFPQTNNTAELLAILHAVNLAPPLSRLNILTDSQYSLRALTAHLEKAENDGFLNVANSDIIRPLVSRLRLRPTYTLITKVKGHSGLEGNEGADAAASLGATLPDPPPDSIDTGYQPLLTAQGVKLQTASQATLHRSILALRKVETRPATVATLTAIQNANAPRLGLKPTHPLIWHSLRNKAISRNARTFIWKTIHSAYRVGKYWSNIPEFTARSTCTTCNTIESMSHILTECQGTGQLLIWSLARDLLSRKGYALPQPSLGLILGCGLNAASPGRPIPGIGRLYTIVISESAHLIWKLRCRWRIQCEGRPHDIPSPQEVQNKWTATMQSRLKFDALLTDKMRYGQKALSKRTVLLTWKNTLLGEDTLPADWTNLPGVLVGMARERRPPGRNR